MSNLSNSIIFTILFNIVGISSAISLPRVTTVEGGEIIGTYYTTVNNRIVNAFLGIPYAAPPIGEKRFKPPQPMEPWTGFWNASTYSSECAQYDYAYRFTGDEDCLYLNVFTPELPVNGVSKLMDVMVFVHGGAFMFGSGGIYEPDHLFKHGDIIYVSLNYRLGPFGFLSTGDQVVPGNNGLKDQVAALKWIHRNIIKFGGNPSSVTITGMSAGGASVHYHYLSPSSRGLFQRGISFSGTAFPIWTMPKNVVEISATLAAFVGCGEKLTKDTIRCLQKRPARQLLRTIPSFTNWKYFPFTIFGPVVEPLNDSPFLTEDPLHLIQNGKVANVPWLVSICKDEGLYPVADFIHSDDSLKELNEGWYDISPYLFHYNHLPREAAEDVSRKIKEFYFGEKPIQRNVVNEITRAVGDRLFMVPIKKALKLHASVSTAPVYCFAFNYRGKYSLSNMFTSNLDDYGVSHGDDLQYVLKVFYAKDVEMQSDREMVDFLTPTILSFIRTGNPNIKWHSWKSVSGDHERSLDCLRINSTNDVELVDTYDEETHEFWNSILPEEYLTTNINSKSRHTEL